MIISQKMRELKHKRINFTENNSMHEQINEENEIIEIHLSFLNCAFDLSGSVWWTSFADSRIENEVVERENNWNAFKHPKSVPLCRCYYCRMNRHSFDR